MEPPLVTNPNGAFAANGSSKISTAENDHVAAFFVLGKRELLPYCPQL
jgi:hypothetical protein